LADGALARHSGCCVREFIKYWITLRRHAAVSGTILLALLGGGGIFLVFKWPFSREKVVASLEHLSLSRVHIGRFHPTFFPWPGYVAEELTFTRNSDGHLIQLASVRILRCQASWPTILVLTHRVDELRIQGLHVYIPARVPQPMQLHPAKVIQPTVTELVADGANVEIAPRSEGGHRLRFDFPKLVIGNVAKEKSMTFRTVVHSPEPPGNLTATGRLGPLKPGKPGEIRVSGVFDLAPADLRYFHVISGMLSSHGSFSGSLADIKVSGKAYIPNFEITSSQHAVGVSAEFSTRVDPEHGKLAIQSAEGHFLKTTVSAHGSIGSGPGQEAVVLDLSTPEARVEDLLRLIVKADRAPLYGNIVFRVHLILPSGPKEFLRRVRLRGQFNINDAHFSRSATQEKVNELSKRARTKNRKTNERVVVGLKADVAVRNGTAFLSNASFRIPGAIARGKGTYNLLTEVIQLHGRLAMQASLSQAADGMKSIFLLPLDPLFRKDEAGAVLPFRVTGTYSHPLFKVSLTGEK
jgi:hypothetical protein